MAIDAALGRLGIKAGVCTSSTRPANPYEGQVIYETDTNRTLVYDNSAWLVVADNQVLSIDTTNSRVGINDTSPSYALDVTGDINASGDLRIGGTAIGEWTAYTPTTYGLTIGNGTLTGRYTRINDLVFFNVYFVMGSTSAVTGSVAFGLPVTRVATGSGGATGYYANSGTSYNTPAICDMGGTTVSLRVMNTSSTYVGVSLLSATVPFTWATGDPMSVAGFYEAA